MRSAVRHLASIGFWPAIAPLSYLLARLTLAGVYIAAGASKLGQFQDFAVVISGYGLAPQWALMPLAVGLPLLEIAAGLALLADLRGSLAVLTGLTLMFMAVLWHGISLGLNIDCGCYAPGDPEADAYHGLEQALLRDVGLLALAMWCYWLRHARRIRPRSWRALLRRNIRKGETSCAQ